jgi:hypothetical protein
MQKKKEWRVLFGKNSASNLNFILKLVEISYSSLNYKSFQILDSSAGATLYRGGWFASKKLLLPKNQLGKDEV